jgi:hypothetical protein
MTKTYKTGQKVTCNGNPDGTIISQYSKDQYEVRLWSGSRLVGNVVVSKRDLDMENE